MQLRLYSIVIAGAALVAAGGAVLAQWPLRDRVVMPAHSVVAAAQTTDSESDATALTTSRDLIDSIGVNTHIHYTDGGYADVPKTIAALKYLGIHNLRDAVPDPSLAGGGGLHFGNFADAGFKFDFVVVPNLPLPKTLSLLEDFARAHPDAITAIEGPNEVNNWPVTYKGETGPKAAIAYQADLYAAVKDNALLSKIPVYNLTSWPVLIGKFDVYNVHTYPPQGEQPETHVKNALDQLHKVDQKGTVAITEVGYYTLPGKGTWGGVDDETQAKLSLNLILDAVRMGIPKIYLYQLLDAYPDPTSSEMEKHFGLFDIAYKPKPAASAIHNLIEVVSPGPQHDATRTAKPLALSVAAGNISVKRLLIDGDKAVSTLILWDERKIWDDEKNTPLPVTAADVTIDGDTEFAQVDIVDPTKGSDPVQTVRKTRALKVQLEGYPLLIKLRRP